MVKLAFSRLLFGDFVSNDKEDDSVISEIEKLDFAKQPQKDKGPSRFQIQNITGFIAQLEKAQSSYGWLFQYIKDAHFWIYGDGILPLKVVVI